MEKQGSAGKRVLIIGGGPAGLSAGLWLRNLGLEPCLVDRATALGGALRLNFLENAWVLGQPGKTGLQLAEDYAGHARQIGLECRLGCSPVAIFPGDPDWRVILDQEGERISSHFAAMIVATGTRFRGAELVAGLPGSESLQGRHVAFGPFAFKDMEELRGMHVAIVGGGDNAFENARLLLEAGARVTVLARSAPRAQQQLMDSVLKRPDFLLLQPASLAGCGSTDAGALTLEVKTGDSVLTLPADRLHVLAGYEPNTGFLDKLFPAGLSIPACDPLGYLLTDAWGRTTIPGIYAAGDVCNREFPSVVSALSGGARVAKAIESDLRTR